jgi:hypothetical protein
MVIRRGHPRCDHARAGQHSLAGHVQGLASSEVKRQQNVHATAVVRLIDREQQHFPRVDRLYRDYFLAIVQSVTGWAQRQKVFRGIRAANSDLHDVMNIDG